MQCATDPSARHGPYYEWGHIEGGKRVSRMISPQQAAALRHAIANYRKVKARLQESEAETERLIDLEHPRSEQPRQPNSFHANASAHVLNVSLGPEY